ncbi:cobyric acid synthase [Halococcoides cellulosivorans]|nr:cobyric acid synthase [Halococcoides cellulosivorans]
MAAILVAGTASHVGKSTVATGLARLLADRGLDVEPFKAQNMSTNARVAVRPEAVRETDDPLYGEIGVAQHTQARAAGVPPSTDHNPVLLKPRGDSESQLLLDGRPVAHADTAAFYGQYWERARETALAAYDRLDDRADVVVAEGAGSIAEINLHDRDLPNVEFARATDAQILLVVDIERGGAFAALYGTLELLPEDVRDQVVGAIVTKFRGDRSLLDPGIDAIERRTDVPVLAVLPHDDPGLPDEDSLSVPTDGVYRGGAGDSTAADVRATRIVVPQLPRLSNVADLDPLATMPGVEVVIRPLDRALTESTDAVVLPGTKNTVAAARAAREAGLGDRLATFSGPIVGLCGGYQILGERLHRADRETGGSPRSVAGLGLLAVETTFAAAKTIRRARYSIDARGPISGASGTVAGYEIHAGQTTTGDRPAPLDPASVATDRVLGTYLHGVFEHDGIRRAFLDAAGHDAARDRAARAPIDRAADLLRGRGVIDALDVASAAQRSRR